jgi:hypothetical protein
MASGVGACDALTPPLPIDLIFQPEQPGFNKECDDACDGIGEGDW